MFKFTLLRFNDFDDEWSTYKLSELSEQVKRKKENITDKDNILTISANKGFISQKERWDNVIAGKSLKKYTYLKKDEFSYNRGNSKSFKYGCIYRLNYENALVPNVYHSFRITNGDINFFEQLFQSKQLDKQLIKIITSTARMDGLLNISANNFFNIDVNIPNNLKEQKLIGDFLKLIDIKIELLENKYENYLNFKKYIMQQIFTQKLRFDFVEVKLKDISKINKGEQLNKDVMIEDGKYYVLNGGKDPSGYTNEWNVSENTITISEGGNSCGYVNFNTEKFWSGGHCYYLSNLDENVDDYYLYNYLKFKEKFIMHLRVGSGLPNIQKRDIENIKIQIISKNNQNKISNLFLFVDKKINSIQIQKENFENFKKGLLQQMFV